MKSCGNILLFQTEMDTCQRLGTALLSSGYDVVRSHTYEETLTLVEEIEVDLVLVDISVSENQGLDIITDIKKIKNNLPIIITSKRSSTQLPDQPMFYGASACVSENAEAKNLLELISETLCCGKIGIGKRIVNDHSTFTIGKKVRLEVIGCKTPGDYSSVIYAKSDEYIELLTPSTPEGKPVCINEDCMLRVGTAQDEFYYCFAGKLAGKKEGRQSVIFLKNPRFIYKAQRRNHPRKDINVPVNFSVVNDDSEEPTQEFSANIINISQSGARLLSEEELSKGDIISIEFTPADKSDTYKAAGHVLRSNAAENLIETAFKFSRIDEGFVECLVR